MEFAVMATTFFIAMALQQPNYIWMALLIIAATLSVASNIWLSLSKWAALAVLLIFVGGMMVLFLYVTSLSNNSQEMSSKSLIIPALLILSIMSWNYLGKVDCYPLSVISELSVVTLIYLIFYLGLTLLLVTKITQSFKGALSQKFF